MDASPAGFSSCGCDTGTRNLTDGSSGIGELASPGLTRSARAPAGTGPVENYGFLLPVNSRSCAPSYTANWSLYRIRWDHHTNTGVVEVEDGNVHPKVADRAGAGLVTFGGAVNPPAPTERIPQVTDFNGDNPEPVVISSTTPALTECHHPAFNETGDAILCTGQEPAEEFDDGYGPQYRRRLHQFSWNGSAWADGVPLVGALSAADFQSIATDAAGNVLTGVFPPEGSAPFGSECRNYVWKFGEYCGSNRFVAATVFCTDSTDPADRQVRNARVVLIDLDADDDAVGSPAAYHDLTALVEDYENAQAGTFNAVFSTCHPGREEE